MWDYIVKNWLPLYGAIAPLAVFGLQLIVRRIDRPRTGRVSLLQPSRYCNAKEIRLAQRVPLDLRPKLSGRVGVVRRVRYSFVRPSSPKPAYLLAENPVWELSDQSTCTKKRRIGGCRMMIRPHAEESARHLASSIRSSRLRTPVPLIVCGLDQYFDPDATVTRCTVAWHRTLVAKDKPDTVIAFGADPVFSGTAATVEIEARKAPKDAIWLIVLDSDDSDTGQIAKSESNDSDESDPTEESEGCETCCGLPDAALDPWNGPRRWRYGNFVGLLVSAGGLLWLAFSLDWSESERTDGHLVLALAIWLVLYILALLAVFHVVFYWTQERRASWSTSATTTRCLVEGWRIRNGYYRSLCRCNRFRVRMRH